MSSVVSSALVLVLFAALAAPAALVGVGGSAGRATTVFYTFLLIGVLAYYASFPASPTPGAQPLPDLPVRAVESSPCEDALAAAQRGRVVLDRSAPDRLVVNRKFWRQLPENLRVALTDCASQVRSDGQGEPVEIVERTS